MRTRWRSFLGAAIRAIATGAVAGTATLACGDSRDSDALPQVSPPGSATETRRDPGTPGIRTSDLRAGGPAPEVAARNPYADDPDALRVGKALYATMNCNGCHGSNGGGGIGPPLSDDAWIYGSELENIVQSMLQGRPNGMPSFGGTLPQRELWKIAVFVHSLGGGGRER